MPKRIQMSRQHPWRAANPDAVIVARPSKWGNPFSWKHDSTLTDFQARQAAVAMFKIHSLPLWAVPVQEIRDELRGHDLACWCPLDQPCHADVLLELANRPEGDTGNQEEH